MYGRLRFVSMRRVLILYFQQIRFLRFDNESMDRGLPVLAPARGLDPWPRPEENGPVFARLVRCAGSYP